MKKNSFERSLAAHVRLFYKHEKNKDNERSRRLMNYHRVVHDKQLSRGRILSAGEKRSIYKGYFPKSK